VIFVKVAILQALASGGAFKNLLHNKRRLSFISNPDFQA
jgi:hypothetical protein